MSSYVVKGESLAAIAAAIREKTGSTEKLTLSEMPEAILNIQAGEVTYIPLEYIESTGVQYFNTGFVPNSNTRIVLDIAATRITSGIFFGARGTTGSAMADSYSLNMSSGNEFVTSYGREFNLAIAPTDTERHVWDKNKNRVLMDGTQKIVHAEQTFACNYDACLLAINNAGTPGYAPAAAKLYGCRIYDDGVLVRDYVPCRRKSDSAVGLWDKVHDVFCENAGSGEFLLG